MQRGQAIQLEGTVVIIEVSVTGWGSARDSKQGIENDTGSSTEDMRSLVLGNKMYQEGKGEPTGGKRCLLWTRAPLSERGAREGNGDVLHIRAPVRSPDAGAGSPHLGPTRHPHLRVVS